MLAATVNTSWLLFWWSPVPVAVRARGILNVSNVVFLSPSKQKFGKSLTIHRHRENPCLEYDKCASVRFSCRLKSCYCRSRKHSQRVLAHCTSLEMLDVFRLRSSRIVCRSHQQQPSSPRHSQHSTLPAPHQTRPPFR